MAKFPEFLISRSFCLQIFINVEDSYKTNPTLPGLYLRDPIILTPGIETRSF